MKTLIPILLFTLSFNLYALDWYDMDLDRTVRLEKKLEFTKEKITLKTGDTMKVWDVIDLGFNVLVYQFEMQNCPGPDITTEMIIVNPNDRQENDPSVGVQIQETCLLEVFVEAKDVFSKSLFK